MSPRSPFSPPVTSVQRRQIPQTIIPSASEQQKIYAGRPHREQREDGGDRGRSSDRQRNGEKGRVTGLLARVEHHVGRNAENRTVPQRGAPRKARQEIDRHGEDAENQHFGRKPDPVGRKGKRQHRSDKQYGGCNDHRQPL
jgi:hypothetical protein